MTASRLDSAPTTEVVSRKPNLTEFLSSQTPTGAPALRVGDDQVKLANIVAAMSKRIISECGQEPAKPELPALR